MNARGQKIMRRSLSEPVSIVMPVYNECEVIETVLATYVEVVFRHLPAGSEFILEDGGSTDGTTEILRELHHRWPFLKIIYKQKRQGIPSALKGLIHASTCPWVFLVDSDGQSLASEFWKLAPCMGQADFILGLRSVRHDPFYRRIGSRVFSTLAALLFRFELKDINAAFRLCRREKLLTCAEHYRWLSNAFFAETTIWGHVFRYRILEVEVMFGPRLYGKSHAFPEGTQVREFIRHCIELLKFHRATKQMRREKEPNIA